MKRLTIRGVAEIAGVSIATVSRALTHPERVTEATREKVEKAVRETGFVPNSQAVNFRRRSTRSVILLVRDISNAFYLDVYRGVEETAFASGYHVLMGDGAGDDKRILHYIDMVRNRLADGLILMTSRLPKQALAAPLPPMVVSLEEIDSVRLPTVAVDNRAAARLGVEHLVSLGHRRIAHITGPMHLKMATDRLAGWRDALDAAGVEPDPALVLEGDFHLSSGAAATERLLASGAKFTAIFASNDEMAVGAIAALRARGRRVPDDVSILGFDDSVYALAADPPLTTVRQPRREIGSRSMDLMIAILDGEEVSREPLLSDVDLAVRRSTAPAPTNKRRSR
ncbi:LacI family DNA-binding transcriptional regulator [Consotaella salsifontis]|uniref:Transcriptional regulator, LacI family n=1 Tax=Consotaella salsifontis TaxID=1365950 RepID=A0A1T4TBF8_9HYPH|nr:LacI family DNA-binding transcriptional regulator [Consotaella salsifontis]SKA37743.1 transcriptional regulator, LacI family [Consotaella salsifontis]